jgi:ribosomal protein S11
MKRRGGGIMDTVGAVSKVLADQAQVQAFEQLEKPENQAKAVELIVAAPGPADSKIKIANALSSIATQVVSRLRNPPPVPVGGKRKKFTRKYYHW